MKVFTHIQYQPNNTQHRHAELGSASDWSAKLHPTFGLSGKSIQALSSSKPLKHLTASPTDTGSHNSLRCVGSLCKVQGDNLYYHPNINYRISFGALKKNQFAGIDLAVVEKFKAPIEKFNSNEDLQDWAKGQAEIIANTDFGGRQEETVVQRKAMLKEWSDYVLKENDAYNNATALLILSAVTKELNKCNDKLPPVLNKGVLADCISEIDKNSKSDRQYQFDLNKMYETKLRALYLEDTKTENGNTGWVIIPSKDNDPEHFEQNVEKFKTLSHKNWCTKSFNAEPYLAQGDFHVYLENGEPKLGVRFVKNEIREIQGEKNNCEIPLLYFDEVQKHIEENSLKLTVNAQREIEAAKKIKAKIEMLKTDLKEAIETGNAKAIFSYFDIFVDEAEDGLFTISCYHQPNKDIKYEDLGIDENILCEKVKKIGNYADFRYSQATDLSNLESIGGNANFYKSKVTKLNNLKTIGGYANFEKSQVKDLRNLETIGWHANFEDSEVKELGKLKTIGSNAFFKNSKVKNLRNLKSIGGVADFSGTKDVDISSLEIIGGEAYFTHSKIKDLSKLKSVNGKPFIKKD